MSRIMSGIVSSFVSVAVCCVVAAPAFAQDPPAAEPAAMPPPVAQQPASAPLGMDGPGLDLGVRVGYALPLGSIDEGDKTSDTFSGAIPLVLEAGYRLNANFTIGALFQYGIAQVKDTDPCGTTGVSCSGSIVRLGIEALYNFNLDGPVTPWVGLGTGYEWMSVSAEGGGQNLTAGAHGFELATIHAGGDYRLSRQLALGLFASLSIAQYSTISVEGTGVPSQSMDITNKAIHEWLQIGVRGKFGI
jgi:hypothetical protein